MNCEITLLKTQENHLEVCNVTQYIKYLDMIYEGHKSKIVNTVNFASAGAGVDAGWV